ncbi:DMT family transporter [Ancylobacter oerskovii]|uniref:DMT family transporter n=1 Tax=Ancylobacter oerskovii TaxID=459519 RepID=A0ABW4YTU9_9HYPH|nr:DMT family transporter [Ancylobacter oerskovii]MBS7543379.1 DMT family transporter [Ancylobacter oerskovii]
MLRPALGPALLAVAGIFLLSIMDGMIKFVGETHSTPQVAFMRYLAGGSMAFLVFAAMRTRLPSRETLRPHAWRSLVVTATALSFFYALSVLPLAVVLALSFTSPIFIALFAAMILGERPTGSVVIAIGIGFLGVLVVLFSQIAPGAAEEANLLGIAAALVSAVTYALSMVVLKSRAARDPLSTIVLLQNLFPALLIAPLGVMFWTAPDAGELALMLLIGALGTAGHLCLAAAYQRADASRLGVFEYTAFIWAILIGFFAFGEIPGAATLLGAGLIIGGALIASRRARVNEPEVDVGP